MDRDFFLKNLWLWKCGKKEKEKPTYRHYTPEIIRRENWSEEFEQLRFNRMYLGAYRYGTMKENKEKGVKYNCIKSIKKRLLLYEETGNLEHLVDIANISMVEFVTSVHPNKHFESQDDGEHTEEV